MLIDAVRVVASGGIYLTAAPESTLSPAPAAAMARSAPPPAAVGASMLTGRETEVLRSVSSGLTHKQIARELGLSKTTVDTYLQRVRQKLGVGNKAELAGAAYRFGLWVDVD